jgi:hypothetical protein
MIAFRRSTDSYGEVVAESRFVVHSNMKINFRPASSGLSCVMVTPFYGLIIKLIRDDPAISRVDQRWHRRR